MKRTIEITFEPDGGTKIDAIGFKGSDCRQATGFLEQALGVRAKQVRKAESYQTARRGNQQKLGS